MFLRATFAAAVLLTGVPALAGTTPDPATARAEQDATTRCTMRQLHVPAGRGIGGHQENCAQVARAQVAALKQQGALASRKAPATIGRD